jgi:hypothetical protein
MVNLLFIIYVKIDANLNKKVYNYNKELMQNQFEDLKFDIESGIELNDLIKKYNRLYKKYRNGFMALFNALRPKPDFNIITHYGKFLDWQKLAFKWIDEIEAGRGILNIVDYSGRTGKSEFAKHLEDTLGYQRFENGKTADIANVWDEKSNIVFDLARSSLECINYGVIENLINGRIFSPKYQSCCKASRHKIKVVVLSNEPLDVTKMSIDRFKIMEIWKSYNGIKLNAKEARKMEKLGYKLLIEHKDITDEILDDDDVDISKFFSPIINTDKPVIPKAYFDEVKELTRMVNKNLKTIKHYLDNGVNILHKTKNYNKI